MNSTYEAAIDACLEIDLIFKEVPNDGRYYLLDVKGKTARNGDGRIRLFPDATGGLVWNHTTHETRLFWARSDQTLTPAEQIERKKRAQAERERADKEILAARMKAAETSRAVLKVSFPPENNEYLNKKRVTPTGTLREITIDSLVRIIGYHPKVKGMLFSGEKVLIAAVRNHEGLTTIEMIDHTGLKAALFNGAKKGCFWATDNLPENGGSGLTIGIGEGVATMLTYHMAFNNIGVAALSCGNLKEVAQYFRGRYPEAIIDIVSDIGNGEQHAIEAASAVNARIVIPVLPAGSAGSDINDVYTKLGLDEVRRQIRAAKTLIPEQTVTPTDSAEPLPLLRVTEKNDPFPIDKLPPVIQAAAARVMEVIQAPLDLVCQSFLAAITLATQPLVDVTIDGRRFPVSNNFIALGVSGERKSAVDRIATGPIKDRQQQQTRAFLDNKQKFEAAHTEWEARRKEALRETDRDVIEALLNRAGEEPKHLQPCHLVSEPSFQGIERVFAEGRFCLGLFSDEGGKFLGGYSMSKENRTNTITGLSKLWDGDPLDRLRGGDGLTILYGRRFSLHLMLQPVLAGELFGNSMLSGQGFLSRCLCCWPESTIGNRPYKAADLANDETIQAYNASINAILDKPEPMNMQKEMGLSPQPLCLTAPAKAIWESFHNHIEAAQKPGGELFNIIGFASKSAEHAARIAGALTAFQNPDATEIDEESIDAGIEIAQFYLGEALRLFHSSNDDPFLTLAEECFKYGMEKTGGVIGLRNLYQSGPNAVRSKEKATHIIRILEDHHRAVYIKGGAVVAGKQNRDAWQLIPLED